MKQKNILKFLILSLCLIFVFCLTACKQDTTNPKHDSSTATSLDKAIDNSSQDIISGIELEEDIFDNSTTQGGSSPSDTSSNNASSNISSNGTVSDKNESTDNISGDNTSNDTSSEQNPDTEDSNSSQEGVVVEDGVIKLPIDKFD